MDFIASLLGNIWSIFLIVLFFGGSIFVHELGHFLAARRRGAKVDRFSIGFGKAIWSWHGQDGVEYRISWLPLGGYVALPQLADMSGLEGGPGSDAAKLPPISYGTKMLILVAGAFFNVLFAFALACILWLAGQIVAEQEQTTRLGLVRQEIELPNGNTAPGPAYAAGLREGDLITAVDGHRVSSFLEIAQFVALGGGRGEDRRPRVGITYERHGQSSVVQVFPQLVGPEQLRDIGVEPAVRVTVDTVQPGSVAGQAGLQARDVITAIDGKPANYVGFVTDHIRQSGGKPLTLSLLRANEPLTITVQPRKVVDPETKKEIYRLGVQVRGAVTIKTVHVAPWTQLLRDAQWTWRSLVSVLNPQSDIGLSKLSGPIGIGERVYTFARLDFKLVLAFIVLVNVNLAIFNLLPIPVLDGGHMLFATIGKLRGRALPFNFIATMQSIFYVLLFSVMIYVTVFGDLRRIVRDSRAESQAREAAKPAPKAAEPAPAPAKP